MWETAWDDLLTKQPKRQTVTIRPAMRGDHRSNWDPKTRAIVERVEQEAEQFDLEIERRLGRGPVVDRGTTAITVAPKVIEWDAKPIGGRRERHEAPAPVPLGYKAVVLDDGGRMWSIYDRTLEYRIGVKLYCPIREDPTGLPMAAAWTGIHRGGLFTRETLEELRSAYRRGKLVHGNVLRGVRRLAILECEVGGKRQRTQGKVATDWLIPLRVVEEWYIGR